MRRRSGEVVTRRPSGGEFFPRHLDHFGLAGQIDQTARTSSISHASPGPRSRPGGSGRPRRRPQPGGRMSATAAPGDASPAHRSWRPLGASTVPTPTIATCGGTTTSWACRPPMVPKFDNVIVCPRSSAGGIVRARTSRFRRSSPSRRSSAVRRPASRSTGTSNPSLTSTRDTEVDRRAHPAGALLAVKPGVQRRRGGTPGHDRPGSVAA